MIRFQVFSRARSEPSLPHERVGSNSTLSTVSRSGSAPSVLQSSSPQPISIECPRRYREDLFARRIGANVDAPHGRHAGAEKQSDERTPHAPREDEHARERHAWLTQQITKWQTEIDLASTPAFWQQNPRIDPLLLQDWRRSQIRQVCHTLDELARTPRGIGSSSQAFAPSDD
jgi:hypothetical protein